MSKSLKNFRKISEFTEKYNANTLRLYFMKHKWEGNMNFTEEGIREASTKEKTLSEFFQNLKVVFRENDLSRNLRFDSIDQGLLDYLAVTKQKIHNYFCDSFNTGDALLSLFDLITKSYSYIDETKNKTLKIHVLYSIGNFVSKILKCLGMVYKTDFIDFFVTDSQSADSIEKALTPYLDVITQFRDEIKIIANNKVKINKLIFLGSKRNIQIMR
jgi:cysteinyl-tRNA synthetase